MIPQGRLRGGGAGRSGRPHGGGHSLGVDRAGRRLASGDQSGAVILWDLATPHIALQREKLPGMIRLVAFLDDSRLLVGTNLTVVVVDPDNGKEIRRAQLDGLGQAVHAIAPMRADWRWGPGRDRPHPWPARPGGRRPAGGGVGGVVALAITRDGSLLASAGEDRRYPLLGRPNAPAPCRLATPGRPDPGLGVRRRGPHSCICGRDEVVTVWDIGLVRRAGRSRARRASLRSRPAHPRS